MSSARRYHGCCASPDATLLRRGPQPPIIARTTKTLPAWCSKSADAPANRASAPSWCGFRKPPRPDRHCGFVRSEEHTSELQSHSDLVCRLLLEKKKKTPPPTQRRPLYLRSAEKKVPLWRSL